MRGADPIGTRLRFSDVYRYGEGNKLAQIVEKIDFNQQRARLGRVMDAE
jgi:hypothetical protein